MPYTVTERAYLWVGGFAPAHAQCARAGLEGVLAVTAARAVIMDYASKRSVLFAAYDYSSHGQTRSPVASMLHGILLGA